MSEKDNKNGGAVPEMQVNDEHLLVSVMPKEFRGTEGLMRQVFDRSKARPPKPEPKPLPPPPPKTVTPNQSAQIKPPPIPPKAKFPWIAVIIGVVVLSGFGIGAWFFVQSLKVEPTPIVTPEPLPPVAPRPPVEPTPVVPITPTETPELPNIFGDGIYPGKDSDSDGLTDIEEELYGSNPVRPDTDGDAHIDGNEVHHLYDPNGLDPSRLIDRGIVDLVAPTDFGYSLWSIKGWNREIQAAGRSMFVRVPSGETLQVVLQPIDPTGSISDWYASQTPISDQVDLETDITKQGFAAAWTDDHLTSYVRLSEDTLAIFTYQLGDRDRVQYRQTFEMMINSLKRVEP